MNTLLNFIMLGGMPAQGEGQTQSPQSMFIMLALIIVVFYFFMIRPQVKRQKELKNFREGLAKGDKVITSGGIYGKIASISETVMTIDVGNGVTIKVDKTAVLKDSTDLQAEQQKK